MMGYSHIDTCVSAGRPLVYPGPPVTHAYRVDFSLFSLLFLFKVDTTAVFVSFKGNSWFARLPFHHDCVLCYWVSVLDAISGKQILDSVLFSYAYSYGVPVHSGAHVSAWRSFEWSWCWAVDSL